MQPQWPHRSSNHFMISIPFKKVRRHQYHGPQMCHKIVTPTEVQRKSDDLATWSQDFFFPFKGTISFSDTVSDTSSKVSNVFDKSPETVKARASFGVQCGFGQNIQKWVGLFGVAFWILFSFTVCSSKNWEFQKSLIQNKSYLGSPSTVSQGPKRSWKRINSITKTKYDLRRP